MWMTVPEPESEPEPAACCAEASPTKPSMAPQRTAAATTIFVRDLLRIEPSFFDGPPTSRHHGAEYPNIFRKNYRPKKAARLDGRG